MKNLILKTNKYLLENHPTLWNTKIVWILLSAFVLHLVFFTLGYGALTNTKILHEFDAKSIFFKNGTVFISVILSILIIVIWLIYLFKNNAFKSFYPTSRLGLFKQFICYLIIVLCSSTFYLSYNVGLKKYITLTYSDERIKKEIETSNNAALFFSEHLDNYTLNQRRYPYPFNKLYCQTYRGSNSAVEPMQLAGLVNRLDRGELDSLKPHLIFLDTKYYFYTLYTKKGSLNQGFKDSSYKGFVFYKTNDTLRTYYYKDSIFDVSSFEKSANPSYYNHSNIFYTSKKYASIETEPIYDYDLYDNYVEYGDNYSNSFFSSKHEIRNKKNFELLKRSNPKEIKQLLADFLNVADQYEIDHNLTAEKWFQLVYHPEKFQLQYLIRGEKKVELKFPIKEAVSAEDNFYKTHITDYYLEHDKLHHAFENIEEIKASIPYLDGIHFFIWFSFFISALIFMFRVTSLKVLLFTIISTGVLALLITLSTVLYAYIIDFNGNDTGYFISYLTLFIGTIILSIPIFFNKKINKIIVGICLNISIISFILYVLLIISTISLHQNDLCRQNNVYIYDKNCVTLLNSLGMNWSFILFAINLIFIYFYSGIIKKWRALPEG